MNRELLQGLTAALQGNASTNFSATDVNDAAIAAILKEAGLPENPSPRQIRDNERAIFSLIEEAVDEILPKKLENVLGGFAEVKTFARDAEVAFNIEKVGKNRAKLTISKGARGGIYRAARLDSRYFSPATSVYTAAVYVTLEELILGTMTLAELFNNILEGFQEVVYKETFNALAHGASAVGEDVNAIIKPVQASELTAALDEVLPKVKQYGVPTIFGSYKQLSTIANPASEIAPNLMDAQDVRDNGFVQIYKGTKVVELPNYLVNDKWAYDEDVVFVLPAGAKPAKVALKGELEIVRNTQATGSEKWEAHKVMAVGLAMANNYAVIKVSASA